MTLLRRIDQTDMHYRDQRALDILRRRTNPTTKRADITLKELAAELECHYNTATSIMLRLQGAGHVKRHDSLHGRGGADIEVMDV